MAAEDLSFLKAYKVMQTASGLPKKSLEERKVRSEGGRSKASGGKKEGPEAAASSGEAGLQGTRGAEKRRKAVVERLDSERKVARKGV